jgi:hypothetical protein
MSDTAFKKYSRYGMSLLTHMDIYFQPAPTFGTKTENAWFDISWKTGFSRWKVSNREGNPDLELILQKTSILQNEKTGNTFISENVSGDVHRTGLEPVTTRFEAGYSIH